jgi:5-formaminoimidazole-4-carboxamide-1-beta-D-ribofuranosyl 5'-monophosphate synthetase
MDGFFDSNEPDLGFGSFILRVVINAQIARIKVRYKGNRMVVSWEKIMVRPKNRQTFSSRFGS